MTRTESLAAHKRRTNGQNSGPRKCWHCADCIRRATERKYREVTK